VPLHFGKAIHPQNSFSTFWPFRAVRFFISAPHLRQAGIILWDPFLTGWTTLVVIRPDLSFCGAHVHQSNRYWVLIQIPEHHQCKRLSVCKRDCTKVLWLIVLLPFCNNIICRLFIVIVSPLINSSYLNDLHVFLDIPAQTIWPRACKLILKIPIFLNSSLRTASILPKALFFDGLKAQPHFQCSMRQVFFHEGSPSFNSATASLWGIAKRKPTFFSLSLSMIWILCTFLSIAL